jgi:diguanylate cyclase (GGDEF)-like protein
VAAGGSLRGRTIGDDVPVLLVGVAVLVSAAGLVPLLLLEPLPPIAGWPAVAVAVAALMAWGGAHRHRVGQGSEAQITVSGAVSVIVAATLLLPPWVLPLVIVPYVVRRDVAAAVVNYCLVVLPVASAVVALQVVVALLPDAAAPAVLMTGGLAAATAHYLASSLAMTWLLWFVSGMPWRESPVLRREETAMIWGQLALGVVVAVLLRASWWYLPLTVLLVWWAFRYWRLERRAITADVDGTTGLVRYDVLRRTAQREQQRSARSGQPLALVLLDVDELRSVNERMGHLGGDAVLAGVARVVADGTAWHDVAARTGGEEFTLLLLGADLAAARAATERLQAGAASASFAAPATAATVSLSAGITALQPQEELDDALARLDRALYEAKGEGPGSIAVVP